MQVMMHDIRRWGSKKIYATCKDDNFINYIKSLKRSKVVSAYSIPKKYLDGSIELTDAAKKVLKFCEPMIDSGVSNSEALQRRFRNTWNNIWKNFISDNNLDDEVAIILSDFGLSDQNGVSSDIIFKYNSLVLWYLFTSYETNLANNNMTMKDIIDILTLYSNDDFVDKFLPKLV